MFGYAGTAQFLKPNMGPTFTINEEGFYAYEFT
jgi:hypothetical protein